MLDGVKVLNTMVETNSTSSIGSLVFGLFIGFLALGCVGVVINMIYNKLKGQKIEDGGVFVGFSFIAMLFLAISIFTLEGVFTKTTYKTTSYQVTIDNTVKYNDFVNTYDILEHDGSVYIVKLKLEDSIKRKN